MKKLTLVTLALLLVFSVGVGLALWREVAREEAVLRSSISGTVDVSPALIRSGQVDIVRTDRMALMLLDPQTNQVVAQTFESPLVPPQTIRIGEDHTRVDTPLTGSYVVVGITDKDGEILRVVPGEVYGRSPQPVAVGTEGFKLSLTEPYRGGLFNDGRSMGPASGPNPHAGVPGAPGGPAMPGAQGMAGGAGADDPEFSISGTIVVSKAMQDRVSPQDRLIVLLFDPELARPVAFRILPQAMLPLPFNISLPPDARASAKAGYNLRVVTDKDQNPFGAAEGEVVGRSAAPVPLGTSGLVFTLDQPYVR